MTGLLITRFAIASSLALLTISLVFRFAWLDRLPGINGDEAWYGVQIENFLGGENWSATTPSGLPINPLLFVTESMLLAIMKPSFWVLRLPIALWACVGLILTYCLHHWVYRDRVESLLVTTLTACLPMHLAYSRFCWDASFAFVSTPLVLYSLLGFLERPRHDKAAGLFGVGSLLALWIHATHAVFVAACVLVLAWNYRVTMWHWARRRPMSCTTIAIASSAASLVAFDRTRQLRLFLASTATVFERLPRNLRSLGDIVLGPRVYEYLAGMPSPDWTIWVYPLLLLLLATTSIALFCWGTRLDRFLVLVTVLTLLAVLLAGRWLSLEKLSYERYFAYVVPLSAAVFVRGLRAWSKTLRPDWSPLRNVLTVGFSLLLLTQFWANYFEPLRGHLHETLLHRTFKSWPLEPKAEAAAAVSERLTANPNRAVFVNDWWVRWALQYLLGPRSEVRWDILPEEIDEGFVVGFADAEYVRQVRSVAESRGQAIEELHFGGLPDQPVLILLVLSSREIDGPE